MKDVLQENISIRGSGGKGGGGGAARVAIESPDSLRSIEFARTLDAVSEGEIEGPDGDLLKCIYLNDVPIQNEDNSLNFAGVTVDYRLGTQNQSYMPGFPSLESEHLVGIQVTNAVPVVRSISNVNVDMVRVTLSTPALTTQDTSNGDLGGGTIDWAIEVQVNGGGYANIDLGAALSFAGKTIGRYQRSYLVPLPKPGTNWDIRVKRLTADNPPANIQNESWWDSYTEIIDAKLRFPNTAVFGIQVDASQFNNVPTRGFRIKGIRVKVPENYDPIIRSYSGIWDGTFKIAWTDNPVWVYYDLLTVPRYGLGKFIPEDQVDKWGLYTIAQYCDVLVDDGFGGQEPRFACNVYIQTQDEAYTLLANLASVFRAMSYWSTGSIATVQDAPSVPTALYSPANVIDGNFSYQGSGIKARHTVALVTWNDPERRYRQNVEYVEDEDGIARYGIVEKTTVAFSCTSRGQAHRWGQWILYSERLEGEVNNFLVGADGILSPPGSIIHTSDPSRAGVRFSGRIASSTASIVTLDAPVTLLSGKTYTLTVVLPSGSLQTRIVSNGAGVHAALTVTVAYSATPAVLSMWMLAQNDLVPEIWRVIALGEEDTNVFRISALTHNPSKYDFIENGVPLDDIPNTQIFIEKPATPTGLVVTDTEYEISPGVIGVKAHLSWDSPLRDYADAGGVFGAPQGTPAVSRWIVGHRKDQENWHEQPVTEIGLDFSGITVGEYDFYVIAVSALGKRSDAAYLFDQVFIGMPYSVVPPTSSFAGIGGLFLNNLSWNIAAGPRSDLQRTEIWAALSNNRADAFKLTDVHTPNVPGTFSQTYVHQGLQFDQQWWYWSRVYDTRQNPSAWNPVSATAGLPVSTSDDPALLLNALIGEITSSQLAISLATPIAAIPGMQDDIAENASDISTIIAGTSSIGFDTIKLWNFDSTVEGWAGSEATLAWEVGGYLRVDATGATPLFSLSSNFDNVDGALFTVVKIGIKRIAGTGWVGKLQYSTPGHGFNDTYSRTALDPILGIGDTATVEFDMTGLPGDDWEVASTISNLRFELGDDAADTFDIDWIAIGRNSPAASYAAVQQEAIARANTDTGLLAQYTIKVDVNGYVAGYGIAATEIDDVPFSEFLIRADRFAVITPGQAARVPFIVDGATGAVFLGQVMIRDGDITAEKLDADAVTTRNLTVTASSALGSNLVQNGGAEDLMEGWALSQISNAGVGVTSVINDHLGGARAFQFGSSASSSDGRAITSRSFPVIPGRIYSFVLRAKSSGSVGASFFAGAVFKIGKPVSGHITGNGHVGNPITDVADVAGVWEIANGAVVPTSWTYYEANVLVPNGMYWCSFEFMKWNPGGTGSIWVDDVEVYKKFDTIHLNDGVITTPKMVAGSITAASAIIGDLAVQTLNIANGGISSVQSGFSTTVNMITTTADTNVLGFVADANGTGRTLVQAYFPWTLEGLGTSLGGGSFKAKLLYANDGVNFVQIVSEVVKYVVVNMGGSGEGGSSVGVASGFCYIAGHVSLAADTWGFYLNIEGNTHPSLHVHKKHITVTDLKK